MKTLTISLPGDRTKLGTAWIIEGQVFSVLGKSDNAAATAHNNPTRDPLHSFGDTPCGTYEGVIVPHGADVHGFGPGQRILLIPRSGDCLTAERNGRSGLMCHAGDLNPTYTWWGGLRPTNGCVRFHEADLQLIIQAVGAEPLTVFVEVAA